MNTLPAFGIRAVPPCGDCHDDGHCSMNCGPAVDPRDPDPSRFGIFRNHNCAYCSDGTKPCRQSAPNRCEYPHARND